MLSIIRIHIFAKFPHFSLAQILFTPLCTVPVPWAQAHRSAPAVVVPWPQAPVALGSQGSQGSQGPQGPEALGGAARGVSTSPPTRALVSVSSPDFNQISGRFLVDLLMCMEIYDVWDLHENGLEILRIHEENHWTNRMMSQTSMK